MLIGISILTFTLSHVVPADPASAAAGLDATEEQVAAIRERLGLNEPLPVQYFVYMGNLLHGDFGQSVGSSTPVINDFLRYLPASVELGAFAVLLYVPAGILLGVLSSRAAGGKIDALTRALAVLGVSVPVFWLGLMAQIVFYGELSWFPATGRISSVYGPPPATTSLFTVDWLLAGNLPAFVDVVWHMILPAAVLAVGNLTVVMRMTRSSMLEVEGQDYVRTARAKGLSESLIVRRHILRNAMIPVVTVVALQMAAVIAWQFLVEDIFSWPGIGTWAVNSILNFDFNAVMLITLFSAGLYVVLNFLADVAYLILDPRIHY